MSITNYGPPGKVDGPPNNNSNQKNPKAIPSIYNILIPIKDSRILAFNAFTSAYALWEIEDIKLFEEIKNGTHYLKDSKIKDFVYAGYAVSESIDEIANCEENYKSGRFYPGNMTLTIAPTLKCNFACDYCFQGHEEDKHDMPQDVQDKIIEFLDTRSKHVSHLHVAWYGGEPLLKVPIIEDMSKKIHTIVKREGIHFSAMIVTNGWHLGDKTAASLVKSGVSTVQVTLDGPPEYHDSRRCLKGGQPTFKRITDNLLEIVDKHKLFFSIRVNIDSRNREKIKELIDVLHEKGLSGRRNLGLYFAPIEALTVGCHSCASVTMGKAEYAKLEAELYRYALSKNLTGIPHPPQNYGACAACKPKGFVFIPNGDIHKCWDTVMQPEYKVGTVFEPMAIKDNAEYKKWLDWSPYKSDLCRNCKILPNCAGFCGYKTIYGQHTQGEAATVPCPGWKNNIGERLFLKAEKMGIIKPEDWIKGTIVKVEHN